MNLNEPKIKIQRIVFFYIFKKYFWKNAFQKKYKN
jgi:hypothetical protein